MLRITSLLLDISAFDVVFDSILPFAIRRREECRSRCQSRYLTRSRITLRFHIDTRIPLRC